MARAMGVKVDVLPEGERGKAFLMALDKLREDCGVNRMKLSDYGITREELPELARNARDTMGGLFELDRYKLSFEETVEIYEKAFAR